jgi:uncharacterized RDD family membrane protein YckC
MGLDLTVIAGWAAFAAVAGVAARAAGYDFESPSRADVFAFITLVAPVTVTFALQEASAVHATFGKRRMGLQVTNESGRQLTFRRALARSAAKFLPWQLAHTAVIRLAAGSRSTGLLVLAITAQAVVLGSIGAIALDSDHRALHDRVAGTRVVSSHGNGPSNQREKDQRGLEGLQLRCFDARQPRTDRSGPPWA